MPSWDEEGYQLLSTDEMLTEMEQGHVLELVPVRDVPEEVLSCYGDVERASLSLDGDMNDIVSIEEVSEEEVQCILVSDPEHLYLTDYYIPTHNTSNIIFLKSTDDSMLNTLSSMSGKTHNAYREAKNVTQDVEQLLTPNEAKISYTISVKEEPVISYNDLAFLPERNSVVFRAGDAPIWNKNETILPMSWRLFQNKIIHPGHEYSLQTIPTMSTARDFDVRKNIPDFDAMLEKRMSQVVLTEEITNQYQDVTKRSDLEMAQMDPDQRAEEIMDLINTELEVKLRKKRERDAKVKEEEAARSSSQEAMRSSMADMRNKAKSEMEATKSRVRESFKDNFAEGPGLFQSIQTEPNTDVIDAIAEAQEQDEAASQRIFAGNQLSPSDFYGTFGPNEAYQVEILQAFDECKADFLHDSVHFKVNRSNWTMTSADGSVTYISKDFETESMSKKMAEAAQDASSRVYTEDLEAVKATPLKVEPAFYKFLAEQRSWRGIANGAFEKAMAKLVADKVKPRV